MIGGIRIPYGLGLQGHSDADVLLHALADALLGAAGLGDIGKLFPDSAPAWKNAPSSLFIYKILERLKKKRLEIVNVDVTVLAQVPKINPYRSRIRQSVARMLKIPEAQINVKATTTDSMGCIGRKEGIASQAIVLLRRL